MNEKKSYLVYLNNDPTRVATTELGDPDSVAGGILYGEIQTKYLDRHRPFDKGEMRFDKFDRRNAFYMGADADDPTHATAIYGDQNGHTLKVCAVDEKERPLDA
jgi:hypothetical protein